jgi:hypothetical protein
MMADNHYNAGAIWALGVTQIISYGTLYYSLMDRLFVMLDLLTASSYVFGNLAQEALPFL